MSRKTASILLPIWMILCAYIYVCPIKKHCCGNCGDKVENVGNAESGFLITDGDFSTSIGMHDIYFMENSDQIVVEPAAVKSLDALAAHLKTNNRNLTVTGEFLNSETYSSSKEELGLARAKAFCQELIKRGVDSTHLHQSFAGNNELHLMDKKVFYPFELNFSESLNGAGYDEAKMNQAIAYLKANQDKKIYFSSGSSVMDITPDIHEYLDYATYYLVNKPEQSMKTIGFTDSQGAENINQKLGLERAQDVADYLVKRGVPQSQIEVSSQGELNPIGDNSTEEGRKLNRRVELQFTF